MKDMIDKLLLDEPDKAVIDTARAHMEEGIGNTAIIRKFVGRQVRNVFWPYEGKGYNPVTWPGRLTYRTAQAGYHTVTGPPKAGWSILKAIHAWGKSPSGRSGGGGHG